MIPAIEKSIARIPMNQKFNSVKSRVGEYIRSRSNSFLTNDKKSEEKYLVGIKKHNIPKSFLETKQESLSKTVNKLSRNPSNLIISNENKVSCNQTNIEPKLSLKTKIKRPKTANKNFKIS